MDTTDHESPKISDAERKAIDAAVHQARLEGYVFGSFHFMRRVLLILEDFK